MSATSNPRTCKNWTSSQFRPLISFLKKNTNQIVRFLHVTLCMLFALVILFFVNGYKALYATTPRNGRHILKANELVAVISFCNTVISFLCTSWSASIAWKCASSLMQKRGLSITQFNLIAGKLVPLPVLFSRKNWRALLALLLAFSQKFIEWMPPAFVNWNSSSSFDRNVTIQSGNPDSSFWRYSWYPMSQDLRLEGVARAAGMVNAAWGDGSSDDGKRCRHVVNDYQIPNGSTVYNATMPCIVIHDISWPTETPSAIVQNVMENAGLTSITNMNLYYDVPGSIALFDPSNTTLKIPASLIFPQNWNLLNEFGVIPDIYPESFRYSGVMTVAVFYQRLYNGPPYVVDPFGMPYVNNSLTYGSTAYKNEISTYLTVNFTVGVMTPETSNFAKSDVIESGGQPPQATDIVPGPWVKEALYMLSDTMTMVAAVNSTSIPSWNNLTDYTEKLIRYSYLGSWDTLQRSYDPNSTDLKVSMVEPRLEAEVVIYYVFIWLGASLLMILSAFLAWRTTQIPGVEKLPHEGLEGALLIDPRKLWNDDKDQPTLSKKDDPQFSLSWKGEEEEEENHGEDEQEYSRLNPSGNNKELKNGKDGEKSKVVILSRCVMEGEEMTTRTVHRPDNP